VALGLSLLAWRARQPGGLAAAGVDSRGPRRHPALPSLVHFVPLSCLRFLM
jgi:hypothetical protein